MVRTLRLMPLILISTIVLASCSGPERGDEATTTVPPAPTSTTPVDPSPTVQQDASPTATHEPAATATAAVEPTASPTAQPEPTATSPPPPPTATSPAPPTADDVWTVRRFENAGQVVVLTFDAGADRGYTEQILDTLAEEGIKASFGMTGHWAEQHPDLIQRIVDEGHGLINHSWTHRSFTGHSTSQGPLSASERREELESTADLIRDISGVELRPYFRPPYGDYDDSVLVDLAANGYTVNVMWTVDTLGWNGLSAAEINQRVWDGLAPGAIILMHVGAASQDAVALPDMIAGLRDRGYTFATVAELVSAAGWE